MIGISHYFSSILIVNASTVSPVEVTICQGPSDVTLRIRDRGGGVSPADLPAIFLYSFTTVSSEPAANESIFGAATQLAMQTGVGGPLAGLGYGLPMSRKYAEYFGGALDFVSLYGLGCDVFVRLRDLRYNADMRI